MIMKFGLIGYPLTHSFSAKFFNEKFKREKIDAEYLNFEIDDVQKIKEIVFGNPDLKGLNITIPYKETIIPFLHEVSYEAKKIGAVNVIRIERNSNNPESVILKGYNSDYIGFKSSLTPLLRPHIHKKALILGTGGASKAVAYALSDLSIDWNYVSRSSGNNRLTYYEVDEMVMAEHTVIVNASPVGTFPNIDQAPALPYQFVTTRHLFYDLVYNPAETLFMKKGKELGATVKNGAEMLELQALAAWEIWNK